MATPPSKPSSAPSSARTATEVALYPLSSEVEDRDGWSVATVIVTTSRSYEILGKSDSDVEEAIARITRERHPTTIEGMRTTTATSGPVRTMIVKAISDPVTSVSEELP